LDAQPQVLVIAPATSDDSLEGTTVDLNMRVNGVLGLSLLGIALGAILAGFAVFFFMRWWGSGIRPPKKDVDPRPDEGGDGGPLGRNRSTPAESSGRPTRADDQSGPETQPISTVQPGEPPPRRRDLRRRRS